MNPILAMLKEHNISDAQISELFQALTQNPLAAMATRSAEFASGKAPVTDGAADAKSGFDQRSS